jgi:hypothetical protein
VCTPIRAMVGVLRFFWIHRARIADHPRHAKPFANLYPTSAHLRFLCSQISWMLRRDGATSRKQQDRRNARGAVDTSNCRSFCSMARGRTRLLWCIFDTPGIVACEFVDAEECRHTFIDKVPIFCGDTSLDASSKYPQQGAIRCTVLSRWNNPRGRELLRISTAAPDGVEPTGELQ